MHEDAIVADAIRIVGRPLRFEAIEDRLMLSAIATPLHSLLPRLDLPGMEIVKYAPMGGSDASSIQRGASGRSGSQAGSDEGGFIDFNLGTVGASSNAVRSNDQGVTPFSSSGLSMSSSVVVGSLATGNMSPKRVPMDWEGSEGGPIALGGDVSPTDRGNRQFVASPRATDSDDAASIASSKPPSLPASLVERTLLGDWARPTNFEVAGGGPVPTNASVGSEAQRVPKILPDGAIDDSPGDQGSSDTNPRDLQLFNVRSVIAVGAPTNMQQAEFAAAMGQSITGDRTQTDGSSNSLEIPWRPSSIELPRALTVAVGSNTSAAAVPSPSQSVGAFHVESRGGLALKTQNDTRLAAVPAGRAAMFRRAVTILPLLVFLVVDCFALRKRLASRNDESAESARQPPRPESA